MTSKKQKERKKKNREKIARARVLRRRQTLRAQRKQAIEERRSEDIAEEKAFGKQKPFVKADASALNDTLKEEKKNNLEELNSKLEHNLKILEALEEEYDRENEARKDLNKKLENDGFNTIKEKMDALHKRALELEGIAGEMEQAKKDFENQKVIDCSSEEVKKEN